MLDPSRLYQCMTVAITLELINFNYDAIGVTIVSQLYIAI